MQSEAVTLILLYFWVSPVLKSKGDDASIPNFPNFPNQISQLGWIFLICPLSQSLVQSTALFFAKEEQNNWIACRAEVGSGMIAGYYFDIWEW